MKTKTTLYLLLLFGNINCQEKRIPNINKEIKMTSNTIEKVLEKQLKQGTTYGIDEAGGGLVKEPFQIEELNASSQIVDSILKSNNFKKLNNEGFNEKIKNIFGRIIDPKSDNRYLYVNFFDKCSRNLVMFKNNEIDYQGTFIDKQNKYISDFYYIPELIDYQKEYSKLNDIENFKIIKKSSYDDSDQEIPHWKDDPNLKNERKKNIRNRLIRPFDYWGKRFYKFEGKRIYLIKLKRSFKK